MAPLEAVKAAPALYGNGSRQQDSNRLYRAQPIAPDIVTAIARSCARTAIADAAAKRGRR
jgi:hypothetical protein